MEKKTCTKCRIEKSISDFSFRKKENRYRYSCKECETKAGVAYRKKNLKRVKKAEKLQRDKHKEKRYAAFKEYYKKNKAELNKKRNLYTLKKRHENPLYKLTENIRSLIRQSFRKNWIRKNTKTARILGCSFEDFKIYIESLWEPWMNYDNYGKYNPTGPRTWQIDHIIPLDNAKNEIEIITLNHYTNLRPLCSKENLDKSNKII